MNPQLARVLFLFALLGLDWWEDPYFGHSPLSRAVASQEAVCQSFAERNTIEAEIGAALLLANGPSVDGVVAAVKVPADSAPALPCAAPPSHKLFELMSLRW
jgi:hypothetical protein